MLAPLRLPGARLTWLTRACVALIVTALWALTASSIPASAHSELQSSDPSNGAELEAVPAQVTLTFGAAVIGEFSQVRVTRDGAALDVAEPVSADNVVTISMPSGAESGLYTVAYQIVSADSHPIAGEISFTVRIAATATPTTSSSSTPTPSASATSPESAAASPTVTAGPATEESGPWGTVLAVVLVIAGIGVAVLASASYSRSKKRP
ncbi:MAG: copper resistance protein CopC [Phycicoccus sp.]|nr:copper resistance protein CopC [Phycicoccus sp.]